jgi:hypothetical protein
MLGSNLSADPGAEMGEGRVRLCPRCLLVGAWAFRRGGNSRRDGVRRGCSPARPSGKNRHPATRQGSPPGGTLNLPDSVSRPHGVVFGHDPFRLRGEEAIQILAPHGHKGVTRVSGRDDELDIALAQKSVRFLDGRDSRQAQLLRLPPLPSPKAPFASPSRLRRIGGDHLDAQLSQRPLHLR